MGENYLSINLDRIEKEDSIVLCDGEAVHVGELGWVEEPHHLGGLEGIPRPVAQHLHPRLARQPLLEVEVDGVVCAHLPHVVGAPVQGDREVVGILHAKGGEVRDVEPVKNMLITAYSNPSL